MGVPLATMQGWPAPAGPLAAKPCAGIRHAVGIVLSRAAIC
jgi:hypothetical protein